jgi:hypothetical protein
MKKLENWFLTNNLILNMEKTKAILFYGTGFSLIHRPILYLNKKEITYSSNYNFLALISRKKLMLGHSYTTPLSKIKQSSLPD